MSKLKEAFLEFSALKFTLREFVLVLSALFFQFELDLKTHQVERRITEKLSLNIMQTNF